MTITDPRISEASTTIGELASIDVSDPKSHREIVRKCQSVISSLQDPGTAALETLASPVMFPTLAVLNDLEIFKKLSEGPLTAAELAEKCEADKWLIVRLMRVAIAWNFVTETGPESYASTPTSNLLATPGFAASIRLSQGISHLLSALPTYLKKTSYRSPSNYTNGLFQFCMNTTLGAFEYRAQNPEHAADFNLSMTIQGTKGAHWTEFFNIHARIFEDGVSIDGAVPLLVDIAGGFGQDLRLVKGYLEGVSGSGSEVKIEKGQLVLEDQASVITSVPEDMHDNEFTYIAHNFFEPQPVKGARVYTLKHILHDWPDDKALEILAHLAASLTRGYSKVWILERIVPDTGADKTIVALDIGMMGIYGALERNREQWVELLGKVGLRVLALETMEDGFGLIEAVLE
ncbi:S-adenosyl-L-methionine-dependent methyltransferase [Aspergillus crustosus]